MGTTGNPASSKSLSSCLLEWVISFPPKLNSKSKAMRISSEEPEADPRVMNGVSESSSARVERDDKKKTSKRGQLVQTSDTKIQTAEYT